MCIAIPCLLFAELTDFLDGFYARKNNEVSDFGKLFDPFADVILHLTTMICYMFTFGSEGGYMYPVLFMLLMIREFSQNFLRMVAAKQGVAIAARKGGKLKTVVYIVSGFYALLNFSLPCLQRGHFQSAGSASKGVPGAIPCVGSPLAGSYSYLHTVHWYFFMSLYVLGLIIR